MRLSPQSANDDCDLTGQNEGHGFAKKENQDYLFWNGLMFWHRTLLRR